GLATDPRGLRPGRAPGHPGRTRFHSGPRGPAGQARRHPRRRSLGPTRHAGRAAPRHHRVAAPGAGNRRAGHRPQAGRPRTAPAVTGLLAPALL
ncbi:MAG: hypothetical protein AVDCRST_MAG89-2152, partial [uncultured Gemmatimonadetes bacterium]